MSRFVAEELIPGVQIYPNVEIGEGAVLEAPAGPGETAAGERAGGDPPCRREAGAIIRPFTTIYAGTRIGDAFQTGQGVSIREDNELGGWRLHRHQLGPRIWKSSGIGLPHPLRLLPRNDDHRGARLCRAPCGVHRRPSSRWGVPATRSASAASLSARSRRSAPTARSLPGVVIGKGSLIGAGSVVVKSIPDGVVAAGNPAEVLKKIEELKCHPGFFERPYVWEPYGRD